MGEKIQAYRKKLGMSQDELGQKLLVSRQTVSLWEKDQTVPSIDNLMRLKEVLGVSVDEILGFENTKQSNEVSPNEVYRFDFGKEEVDEIYRIQRKPVLGKAIVYLLLCVLMFVLLVGSSTSDVLTGISFGMLLAGMASYIKVIRAYNKSWKSNAERICKSTYEYKIFEDFIAVSIYRENEKVRESKCYFEDIEQIYQFDKWLFFQFGGQSHIVRISDLTENSAFYSYMYKNPAKTVEHRAVTKWSVISTVLFVASLLSILGALILVSTVSMIDGQFLENLWMFFFLTPIPLVSVIYGLRHKYKKNVIVGIIMTILLCIYGLFPFIV